MDASGGELEPEVPDNDGRDPTWDIIRYLFRRANFQISILDFKSQIPNFFEFPT
jgi:hypothetical protein